MSGAGCGSRGAGAQLVNQGDPPRSVCDHLESLFDDDVDTYDFSCQATPFDLVDGDMQKAVLGVFETFLDQGWLHSLFAVRLPPPSEIPEE